MGAKGRPWGVIVELQQLILWQAVVAGFGAGAEALVRRAGAKWELRQGDIPLN
jgi:hypothetical protein